MAITYRATVGADLYAVKELNEQLLSENYDWNVWWFIQEKASIYVALDIGRIIGYIAITWEKWPREGAYIFSLAVAEPYRRRGIASMLLEMAWNDGKREGRPLELHCRSSNIAALKFYEKHGFVEVERQKEAYAGEDGLLLRRRY